MAFTKMVAIGIILFAIGFVVNILLQNNKLDNAFVTLIINVAFAKICFECSLQKSAFYVAILGLLPEKKAIYAEYQQARKEMRTLQTAKANVERILDKDVLTWEPHQVEKGS